MIILDFNNKTTLKAIEVYGVDFQLDILQEEAGEVTTAISRMERGRVGSDKVAEEIADFLVSAMSVIPALKIEGLVVDFMVSKLERLHRKMDLDDTISPTLDECRSCPGFSLCHPSF